MRYLRRRLSTIKISVEGDRPGRAGLKDLAVEANMSISELSSLQKILNQGSFKSREAAKNQLKFAKKHKFF